MRTNVERILADLTAVADPARRAAAAHSLLHQWDEVKTEASRIRRDAVLVLRAGGWSHQQVADLLGVKKGTAQLIAAGSRSQQGTNTNDLLGFRRRSEG